MKEGKEGEAVQFSVWRELSAESKSGSEGNSTGTLCGLEIVNSIPVRRTPWPQQFLAHSPHAVDGDCGECIISLAMMRGSLKLSLILLALSTLNRGDAFTGFALAIPNEKMTQKALSSATFIACHTRHKDLHGSDLAPASGSLRSAARITTKFVMRERGGGGVASGLARIGDIAKSQALPIGLMFAISIGYAAPSVGCFVGRFGLIKYAPHCIFFVGGLLLR